MAKSPSFNFYSADFDIGTKFMTDDEVGKYIRMLCAQHQYGHLTITKLEVICKGPVPLVIMEKYVIDKLGLYYNERLDEVIGKKKDYVDALMGNLGIYYGKSRKEIEKMKEEERLKAEHPETPENTLKPPTEAPLTPNAEDIPKEIEPPAGRFKPPSIEEVTEYCKERKNTVDPFDFVNFYAAKGWRIGKEPMKNWKACVHTWENKRKKELIGDHGQHPGQNFVSGQVPASYKK